MLDYEIDSHSRILTSVTPSYIYFGTREGMQVPFSHPLIPFLVSCVHFSTLAAMSE